MEKAESWRFIPGHEGRTRSATKGKYVLCSAMWSAQTGLYVDTQVAYLSRRFVRAGTRV